MITCRFCKNDLRDGARVCAACGRHQRWGTLQSANALVALLVALLSVATLAWDRAYPVFFPARATVQIELRDATDDSQITFDITNLSSVLASVPRFAWCEPVPPARFVQGLSYISDSGYAALELDPQARRSLVLEDIEVSMTLEQDLFPDAVLAPGLRGAFDCTVTPADAHGSLDPFLFRLFVQYVRGVRLLSAQPRRSGEADVGLDPNLFFARAQYFGCGPVNPDPAQPACD